MGRDADVADPTGQQADTFGEHLRELKRRLVRSLIAIGVGCALAYPFKGRLFAFLSEPMIAVLPSRSSFIFTSPAEAFFTYLKVDLLVGFLFAVPVILYQFWVFIAPGLYRHERRLFLPLLLLSTGLFLGGAAFSFFLVFPLAMQFLIGFANDQILAMPAMQEYLGFSMTLLLAFGAAFEIPLVSVVLVRLGVITVAGMQAKRRYVFAGGFIVAAAITPPDVISQLLLGFPIWLLYELGIILSRHVPSLVGEQQSSVADHGN